MYGLALAAGLSLATVWVYWGVPTGSGLSHLDPVILERMVDLRAPESDAWLTATTNLAGQIGMATISVIALAFFCVRYRSWWPALYLVTCGTTSVLLTILLKGLLSRPRPPHELAVPPYEYSGSFPSGHTLNAVVMIGAIAYLAITHQHQKVAQVLIVVLASVFCVSIGATRIYLGHHWFTDVLGGLLIGLACLTLITTVFRWIFPHPNPLRATPAQRNTQSVQSA